MEGCTGGYQKQLHAIYLANDILLKAHAQRTHKAAAGGAGVAIAASAGVAASTAEAVAAAFQPRLGRMLRATYESGGSTDEVSRGGGRGCEPLLLLLLISSTGVVT